jgi:hypothetical protein
MEASHLNDPKPLDTLLLRLSVAVAMELPAHLATTYPTHIPVLLGRDLWFPLFPHLYDPSKNGRVV